MKKQFQAYKFSAIVGIAIVAALLLAMQMSLAPALGDKEDQTVAPVYSNKGTYHARGDYTEDYSCTPGPTGNCRVNYRTVTLSQTEAQTLCDASTCDLRLETRW